MARFKIYSKDGQTVRYEGCPRYNGTYLKVSYLEFSSIASPTPIAWQVGDYVYYPRTGLRYTLRSIPAVKKTAKPGQTGDAFVYQNVQFMAQTQDLAVAPFVDLVPEDNGVHFSTQSAVSTFENAYGIAARIQACLDDLFPGVWDVQVYGDLDADFEERISRAADFSIDGGTCLAACDRMYDIWGIGWTHYKDASSGKDVLLFGRPNTKDSGNTSAEFVFGRGQGLTAIKRSVANSDEMGTRLRVFGSSRNMLPGYYNGLDIHNAGSVDIQNLMIPPSKWGKTDGKPDARKAYLQASDEVVEKLGLIPRTHYFDGSDGEEIYPSLEGATIGDVRDAKEESGDTDYVPTIEIYPSDSERVDEIKAVVNPEDDGYSGGSDGSKYKDTQTVSFPGVNRQQVLVSSNVRPEQYDTPVTVSWNIFHGVELKGDRAVTVEAGMEGYIEDPNKIIEPYEKQLAGRLILTSGSGADSNSAYADITFNKDGTYYRFSLPAVSLENPADHTDMSLRLELSVKATRSADTYFYVTLSAWDFLLGEFSPVTEGFTLALKQIGFDISQRASFTSDGLARVYMKDGMNAGRSFYVKTCSFDRLGDQWLLGMYRTEDESTGMRYPNSQYPVKPGDHFVLLDIAMPELYIGIAQQRLYDKGLEMLNDISRVKPYYEPEVDAIVMAKQSRTLREGMYMRLSDADVSGASSEYVLIDTLTINEGEAEIPTYKVTLREYRRKTFQETTSAAIDSISQKVSEGAAGKPTVSGATYGSLKDKPSIDGVTLAGAMRSYDDIGLLNKTHFEVVNAGTEESPIWALRTKYGIVSESFISARGSDPGAGGGASGVDMDTVWAALAAGTSEQINISHLPVDDIAEALEEGGHLAGGLTSAEMWELLASPTTEPVNVTHIPDLSISKITGLQSALDSKLEGITKAMVEEVLTGTVTSHNHDGRYAPLSGGLIPSQYLPSYVDDVVEYASMTAFPSAGEGGKIYVALDTNLTYRWGGSGYVEISPSLALGHTSSTAYPGDEGAANASAIQTLQGYFSGGAAKRVEHALTLSFADGAPAVYDGSAAVEVTVPTEAQMTLWDRICALFGIDDDGNVYVKDNRGFYGNSFLSARGSDPDAGTSGGGGLDEDALWDILGTSGTEKIDISHIPELSLTDVTGLEDALDGKLSGITGQMVKDALGYTPYDAAAIGSASVAYAASSGTAGKVAHALTVKHDGGSSSASAKTYNGSAAVTVTIPTTLPASDVYAWAKAATKPSYTWGEIGGKPSVFTPAPHTHPLSDISDLHASWDALLKSAPSAYVTRWPAWGEVTGKPSAFTPAEHTHVKADITDFPTSWAWSAITGKPSTLAGYGITDGVNSVTASGGLSASVSGHKLTMGVASGYAVPTSAQIGAWNLVASLFGVDADGNVYVKDGKGFYGLSFVSSRGSDAEAGQGGGTGVDMDAVWDALAASGSEVIDPSHIPALSRLQGALTNAQLVNDSISVAGVAVALGGSVSTAQIASALTAAGYKLTDNDTTYTLTKSGSTITLTGSNGSKTSVTDSNTTYTLGSFGITATAAEINRLDGITASTAELNFVDGVTSNIQTQLNAKANASALAAYALKDGSNASGTWPISISGSSNTLISTTVTDISNYVRYRSVSGTPSLVGSTAGGGAWGLPSTGPDAEYANGQILRLGWSPEYYTDIFTGPNDFGSAAGIQFRQIVAGKMASRGWRTLLDTANYAGYLDTRYLQKSSYTASDILAKLKTVDGSGSGLDADLLDGTQKSGLLTSVASTAAANLSVTVGGTTKSVADLYATYLDGYPATSFDLSTNLGACQDYGCYVIGLMQITDYTTVGNHANGELILIRQNGNNPTAKVIYSLSTKYNTTAVRFGHLVLGYYSNYVVPCTFTYNGKKWAGFNVTTAASYSNGVVCKRDGLRLGEKSAPFLLKYKVSNTGEVLNSEVNGSLVVNGSDIVDDGVSTNRFVGPLKGNAATATKLATARTLWGRPFDGTGNVAGDMTGVGSITMTGDLSMSATSGVGLMIDSSLRNLSWAVNTSGGWARALRATDPTGETVLMNVAGIFGGGQTPNYVYMGGTSYTNAPFVVTAAGNVGIGTTSPNYKLSVVGTGNFTGRIFAQNGVTIGTTDDIGWYPGSGRIMAGVNAARGVNVGDLLVSNAWPDKTKVPTNGIYSKGAVLTDGYLQVGSGRLRWDAANNALYVEKSDGTACGLYSKGYMSARGSDPEAGSSGSGELVPVVDISKLTVGTNVSITVLASAGLTNDVLEKMRDGAVGRVKVQLSDGSTEIWPVLRVSSNFISFGYDTVLGGYEDTMEIYEITMPPRSSFIRVEHHGR